MAYSQNDIKEEYRFINRFKFRDGNNVNLADLQEALQDECDSNGIPVAFRNDTLKTGGLFSKQVEDVLVLYNTAHPTDYHQFLIRITHQGKYAFMDVFRLGSSKNFRNYNKGADGSTTQKIFNSLTGQNQKLQEEKDFYTILIDCMENIYS